MSSRMPRGHFRDGAQLSGVSAGLAVPVELSPLEGDWTASASLSVDPVEPELFSASESETPGEG
jgi:hypothetical protein